MISVVLAQESGLGDYIFGLDPQLIFDSIITLVAMFALFVLLSYLLFNPARNLMEKRRENIKNDMDTAAKEKADAISFKSEYEDKLKNVDKESEEILSETRKKALQKESDIVNEAKEEANRIRERAEREADLEKNKVKDEVKQEIVTVAAAMAEKIIQTSLDEKKQEQLIDDTLKEMGDKTWLN